MLLSCYWFWTEAVLLRRKARHSMIHDVYRMGKELWFWSPYWVSEARTVFPQSSQSWCRTGRSRDSGSRAWSDRLSFPVHRPAGNTPLRGSPDTSPVLCHCNPLKGGEVDAGQRSKMVMIFLHLTRYQGAPPVRSPTNVGCDFFFTKQLVYVTWREYQ